MSTSAEPLDIRTIAIELIDEPDVAMREAMDDSGMEGLADSLRRHGQLQNIGVVVAGDRFRVAYGHRRRLAASRAGLTALVCRVFPEGTPDEQAIKVSENTEQEPVNAAAEATYYRYLLDERCNGDVGKLVALVRRKESFVLARLDLTRGDADVLQALRAGVIPLNVAQELNRTKDPMYRRLWLHDATTHGISARQIRVLREDLARRTREAESITGQHVAPVAPSTVTPIVSMDACVLCQSMSDQNEMTYVKVHVSCRNVFFRQQQARAAAPPTDAPEDADRDGERR